MNNALAAMFVEESMRVRGNARPELGFGEAVRIRESDGQPLRHIYHALNPLHAGTDIDRAVKRLDSATDFWNIHSKRLTVNEYRIVLFFLWLPNADMAVSRVRARVRQGGHNVPETVVRRRYMSGLSNLFNLYWPIAHIVWLLDGSEFPPTKVAHIQGGNLQVYRLPLFQRIERIAKEKNNEQLLSKRWPDG